MRELIWNWTWDIYSIGATIFMVIIAGAVIWVIIDSINMNKKRKVNGNRR